MFFTDGSNRNGIVKAAAIQRFRQGLTVEKISHMSNSSVLNSYVAELYGIHLALQRICQQRLSTRDIHHYTIAADGQNALRSLLLPKCQSEQFMIKLIMDEIEKLKYSNTHVSFRWVPAHEGCLSIEGAHTLASKITKTNDPSPLTTGLKRLKSTLIGEGQKGIRAE